MPTETVEIKTPDGMADAYLAKPDDDQHPGVLFIMDAIGLRPVIAEMIERIASRGYVVLAPNVFYRSGKAPVIALPDLSEPDARGAFFQKLRPLMDELAPDAIERDGKAYLDFLAKVASKPFAITGYCMGARVGLRIAAADGRVAALAGFHGGGLATDAPDSPHLSVDRIKAELYFGHADNDQSNTPEQVATLNLALSQAGLTYRSELYEGAAHGYTMADMPAYDERASERHFRELFALLDRTVTKQ